MPEIDNQPVTDYKSKLVDRMRNSFPDRNFDEQEGQDAQSVLAQSLSEEFDSLDAKLKEYADHESQLNDLMATNANAAYFVNEWIRTGDPAAAFRKIYGRDAFNALVSPEGADILAQIEADEAKKKADDEAATQSRSANLESSFGLLDSWGDAKGLSDEQKLEIFTNLNKMLTDAEQGIYSEEFFDMAWKSSHYTDDIESARKEGEVAGRNARLSEMQKNSPRKPIVPMLSGQGTRNVETPKPPVRTEGDDWEL